MIEKIDNPEDLKGSEFDNEWYEQAFLDCFVNLEEEIERPETIISIGEYEYKGNTYPVPVCTAGEFSCISAPSKSKKSFLKSQLSASYIGGNSNNFFDNIKGHRKEDYYVIDCDTEQSKFYAKNTFKRVEKITGQKYKNYIPLKMRHLTADQRVAFIDNILEDKRYKGKVKLVFIDGIADLIEDSNDLVMSNYAAQKLLTWTDVYNIHVCIIIHNAYNTIKPTGHLGSAVVKKAESVILLQPNEEDKEIVQVSHLYSRGRSFEPFFFKINDYDALPYKCDEFGNIQKDVGKAEYKPKNLTPDQAFGGGEDPNEVPF